MFPVNTNREHIGRRAFLKGSLVTAGGMAVANWGGLFNSQTIAQESGRSNKRCILLWMNGGASQFETFDMKPGRPTGGPFRPIQSNVNGIQVCEYLPKIAAMTDKLAIIRSMRTQSPDHPDGIYHMHTCYKMSERMPHADIGAMITKFLGNPDADLPSFIKLASTPYGYSGSSGYLGPRYEPFHLGRAGGMPEYTSSLVDTQAQDRRGNLLNFMEEQHAQTHIAEPYGAHRESELRALRLMRARQIFDTTRDWPAAKDRYGDTEFGRRCFLARKLVEAGVTFVEVGQENYDSHADNFACHKGNLNVLDPAWSALMLDLQERDLLKDTLIVWMGEVGRTPYINNRAGRDHYVRAWSVVLAGGGIKGGQVYGASDIDGRDVKDNPVTEGDLFATIYRTLGVNHRVRHYVGTRPIWATPEGSQPVQTLIS